MKVQKRGMNTKRHTTMWKIGGKWVNRKNACDMAKKGKIDGVTICRGENGNYIKSLPGNPRLYDLPSVVV